jgi:hypothetical protein
MMSVIAPLISAPLLQMVSHLPRATGASARRCTSPAALRRLRWLAVSASAASAGLGTPQKIQQQARNFRGLLLLPNGRRPR